MYLNYHNKLIDFSSVKKFLKKWKLSGIQRELKDKSYPQTRGMKARKKRYLGKRRNNRKVSR